MLLNYILFILSFHTTCQKRIFFDLYHFGEGRGAGQTGSLWSGRAVEGEQTEETAFRAGGSHGVLDGEEDRAAKEDGGLSDTLRNRKEHQHKLLTKPKDTHTDCS